MSWRYSRTLIVALATLGSASVAEAQYNTPRVRVLPGNGGYNRGDSVSVRVQYCSRHVLHMPSEDVKVNGVEVNYTNWPQVSNTQTDCSYWMYERLGKIKLSAGPTLVSARIENDPNADGNIVDDGLLGQAQSTYSTPWPIYGVSVVAENRFLEVPTSQVRSDKFTFTNTGEDTTLFTASCARSSLASCTVSPSSVTLAPDSSATVSANYTVASSASVDLLTFTVGGGGGAFPASASVWTEVTSFSPTSITHGVTLVNPTGDVDRSLCLTIAAGPGAAFECGDLRLAHALPTVRTRGKARTPSLVYNSVVAQPVQNILADYSLGAGFNTADTVKARIVVTAGPVTPLPTFEAGKWLANDWPTGGGTRRINASFESSALPTGLYKYRLELRRNSTTVVDSAVGQFAVVNRHLSEYGGGWSVAGVERLHFPSWGGILWVGGDGSTRYYAALGGCRWKAQNPTRPDSIRSECGTTFTRYLPNGLRILFDANGYHRYTINRLGDSTEFQYAYNAATGRTRLDRIIVPPASAALEYRFFYGNATGILDSVTAPGLTSTVPRTTKLTYNSGKQIPTWYGGRILSIEDPDSTIVRFHYANETSGQGDYWITSRVDRRDITTTFTYGAGQKLTGASTPASSTQTVAQTFRAADAQGIGSVVAVAGKALVLDSVYTSLDGPRTDVIDVHKWWQNRFGGPLRSRDPVGIETKIAYDATWPALPAKITNSARLVSQAFYSATRALVDSTKTLNPLGDGQNAITRHTWHATWDMPVRDSSPTGEIATREYDAYGNVLWELVGSDTLRKTRFKYDATTRQLVAVYTPTIAKPDSLVFDALGNVIETLSPSGLWARSFKDALGRDTLVVTPITSKDDDSVAVQRQRIAYDIADQVRETRTSGPALTYTLFGTAETSRDTAIVRPETLVVRTTYDEEGNVTRLHKQAYPDPRPWLNTCVDAPVGHCEEVSASDTGSIDVRTYDGVGRLLTQRLTSAGKKFVYDPAGNVVSRQMWNAKAVTKRYDAANRLVFTFTPSASFGREACQHHVAGLLGNDLEFPYGCLMSFPAYPNDAADQLTIPADTARLAYDAAGNLSGAYNAFARIDRTFFANGALKTDTLRFRDYAGAAFNNKYGLGFKYDLSGRRLVTRTPWAADSIRYAYDAELGVLEDVWQGSTHARFFYDLAGRQDSLELAKLIGGVDSVGVREVRRFDNDGQLLKRTRTSSVLGNLITDTIGYDSRGKMTYVKTTSAAYSVGTLEYLNHYSGLGAVTAQQKVRTSTNWDLEEFRTTAMGDVYRASGRHAVGSNTKHPAISTFNQFGALISKGSVRPPSGAELYIDTTYTHLDSDGNIQRTGTYFRPGSSGNRSQTADRHYYSTDHKLRFAQHYSVTDEGPWRGSWEEIWYDALGRKVLTRARRDSLCTQTANDPCSSWIERTVWDGDQILYELRGKGTDTASAADLNTDVSTLPFDFGKVGYVHAGGIDAPLALMDGRVPNYNYRGMPESSVWADGSRADCSLPSGGSGTTCTTVSWPSDNVYMLQVNLGPSNRPTWVGSLLANGVGSTGMAYRRNRFYNPATGQFNQQDPIGLAGGANTYGFADGDPIHHSDPFGLCPIPPSSCLGKAGVSLAVGFVPVLGDAVEIAGALVGTDLITGENIEGAARAITIVGALVGSGRAARQVADGATDFVGSLPKPPRGVGSVPPAQRDPKRVWTPAEREAKRQQQGGQCATGCGTAIDQSNSRGHHIKRHADGGATNDSNHAEVCVTCHRELHRPEE